MEYPDNELVNLVCENSEEARDMLYDKYSYIIDIICNKYKNSAYSISADFAELRQEAMLGFSDALVSYNQDEKASLHTFITLCVERRVRNYVRKNDTYKMKMLRDVYSLDYQYDEDSTPLVDTIVDSSQDPLSKLEEKETMKELKEKVDSILSPSEKEVYELMVNNFSYDDIAKILDKNAKQIYNTAQRIRVKLKDIL